MEEMQCGEEPVRVVWGWGLTRGGHPPNGGGEPSGEELEDLRG